jgi:hypothetical protein
LGAPNLGVRDGAQSPGKGQRDRGGQSDCGNEFAAQSQLGMHERGRANEWGLARGRIAWGGKPRVGGRKAASESHALCGQAGGLETWVFLHLFY